MTTRAFYPLVFLLLLVKTSSTYAEVAATPPADDLKGVGITENTGKFISKDLSFVDENGKAVHLADYFQHGRPVILTLNYYQCPMLCSLELNSLVDSLKGIEWEPGKKFEVVTVSIDPTEKPDLAAKKKASYIASYGKPGAAEGWHFLTGRESEIRKLTAEVGFGYRYSPQDKQYAHGAAIFILTPEGKLSRYLYGIEYPSKDMKLALLEASNGKIGSVVDRILLFCYQYNSHTKKYSLYLFKLMQAGSAGTVLVFGGYLAVFWRRQRKGV